MTTKLAQARLWLIPAIALLAHAPVLADPVRELLALEGDAYFKINPHGQRGRCKLCHAREARPPDLYLRGDHDTTCTVCHDAGKASQELHPLGVKASAGTTLPDAFPLSSEQAITCLSCHDHAPLCHREKGRTRLFLRGGPYATRLEVCHKCHAKDNLKGYNPHESQLQDGKLSERRCLFCHSKALDPRSDLDGQSHLRTKLSLLCLGCHLLTPHAGALEHLVRPRPETLHAMREAEARHGVVFPLDEKGRMTCFTCHNPHQKGVFPATDPRGASYEEQQVPPETVMRWQSLGPMVTKDVHDAIQKTQALDMAMLELEPQPQRNIRLPARQGALCKACHPEAARKR